MRSEIQSARRSRSGSSRSIQAVGGWKSTMLSGEGLVASLTGPGRLHMQTRTPSGLVAWLIPQLPTNSSS